MSPTVKLAEYLFTRLQQLGIGAIHGVPGDYNLALLDYIEPAGLHWVGNTNELNAGYAADGYARTKGIGALVTTYGVGELSAINAIAGAYAELAAVVHIVGTPGRESQDSRQIIHHTLGDGEYRHFSQMYAHVTVAQANLKDPRTSPEQIDEVLRQCLLQSRPVYVEVPVDMVAVLIASNRLRSVIDLPESAPDPAQEGTWAKVLDRMYSAKQPLILVDGESRGLGIVDDVQNLVKLTKWPTWTTIFGKSLVDESLPNVHGIYRGSYDQPEVKSFIDQSDLILCFGPHFSTTNSYNHSSIPQPDVTISFTGTTIKIGDQIFRDMPAKYAISQLLQRFVLSKANSCNQGLSLPGDYLLSFADVKSDQPIQQNKLWRILANFIQPGDIVLGETGTAGYGVREMPLPSHTRLFTPVTWLSIGYMLPASQGAALAQRELIASSKYHGIKNARTILLIGDGSFQMTAQELSTIIRLNLDIVVFLINNDGYTIERCIHGRHQKYNDISPWRYLQAPGFFGAREGSYTGSAKTWGELKKILGSEQMTQGKGLRMVEILMDREDAPAGPLLDLLNKQKVPNCQMTYRKEQ